MTALRAWFDGRSLRERRMILAMLALLVVTILWGLIIVPVRNGLSSSRARYADAVVRLGQAEASLASVKAIQRRAPAPLTGSLTDMVRARADAAGFALAGLDAQGTDQVHATIATAKAGALIAWIASLEADGVLVQSLSVKGNNDGTVAADMTLSARGS